MSLLTMQSKVQIVGTPSQNQDESWRVLLYINDGSNTFDQHDISVGDTLLLDTNQIENPSITSFTIINIHGLINNVLVDCDISYDDSNDNTVQITSFSSIDIIGVITKPTPNLNLFSTISPGYQTLPDWWAEYVSNINLQRLDDNLSNIIGLDSNGDYVPKGSSASTSISSDIEEIFSSLSGGLGASVSVSDSAPTDPSPGDLWWNSDEGVLKIYYSDSDSSQWVDASPSGSSSSSGGSNGTLSLITDGTSTVSFDSANEVVMNTDLNVNAINLSGHIIPTQNAQFDLGNAEYKIRHLFLSDNSLRFGKDGTGDISGEYISFGKDNLDRNAEVYTDQDAGVVPPTPYSAGKKGDIRVFPDFMYVCIRTSEVDDGLTVNWVRSSVESVW